MSKVNVKTDPKKGRDGSEHYKQMMTHTNSKLKTLQTRILHWNLVFVIIITSIYIALYHAILKAVLHKTILDKLSV